MNRRSRFRVKARAQLGVSRTGWLPLLGNEERQLGSGTADAASFRAERQPLGPPMPYAANCVQPAAGNGSDRPSDPDLRVSADHY